MGFRIWHGASPASRVVTRWLALRHIAAGLRLPLHFNDSLGIFAPKGTEENDDNEVVRDVGDLRPLSLKNADNKLIAGELNVNSP